MIQAPEIEIVSGLVADLQAHGRNREARALEKVLVAALPSLAPSLPERTTLTVGQAAAILGVSHQTVYRWIHAGRLPAIRETDRQVIPRPAVEALLATLPRGYPDERSVTDEQVALTKQWHDAIVESVPAGMHQRLQRLHERMEDGEALTQNEYREMERLEGELNALASQALARRVSQLRPAS